MHHQLGDYWGGKEEQERFVHRENVTKLACPPPANGLTQLTYTQSAKRNCSTPSDLTQPPTSPSSLLECDLEARFRRKPSSRRSPPTTNPPHTDRGWSSSVLSPARRASYQSPSASRHSPESPSQQQGLPITSHSPPVSRHRSPNARRIHHRESSKRKQTPIAEGKQQWRRRADCRTTPPSRPRSTAGINNYHHQRRRQQQQHAEQPPAKRAKTQACSRYRRRKVRSSTPRHRRFS